MAIAMKIAFSLFVIFYFGYVVIFSGMAKADDADGKTSQAKQEIKLPTFKAGVIDKKQAREAKYVEGELLVRFKPEIKAEETLKIINKEYHCEIIRFLIPNRTYLIRLPKDKTVNDMLKLFENDPRILYAQPNFIYSGSKH